MRILVTGASGRLGSTVVARLIDDGRHEVLAWTGSTTDPAISISPRRLDLTDSPAVVAALDRDDPDVIIHAAAISSADAVLRDPARATEVNVGATRRLAHWAGARGRRLIFTSTDMVFDGGRSWYREEDPPRPILAYGQTKHEAEGPILAIPSGVVARISLLYGPNPSGRPGFFDLALEALRRGEPRPFFRDEFRTPLDYRTAAVALTRIAESDFAGIIHLGGRERLSRFDLMSRAAVALGLDLRLIRPGSQADARLPEPRPADASLDTGRLSRLLPDLERPTIEEAVG